MADDKMALVDLPVGGPEVMLAKSKVFKEIGALVSTGFFPKAIDTVQKATAICWMADAVGAHPMVALQECYVIHGKVGFEYKFKISLVESKVPGFDYNDITPEGKEQTECVLEGWRDGMTPKIIRYTMDQAERAGRVKQNPLYKTNPEDMLFKQAMHRLLDRVAGHALRGLPVPELLPVGDGAPEPLSPKLQKIMDESAAEVLDGAAADEAGDAGVPEPSIPAPEDGDYTKALGALLIEILGKKSTKKKRLELCGKVMTTIRNEPITYKNAALLSPSDAQEIYEHLMGEKSAAEPIVTGKGEGTPAPPAEDPDTVPAPEMEPEDDADGVEANAPEDGKVETLFVLSGSAKKALPRRTFMKESPKGSGTFWFVDLPINTNLGLKSAPMLQKAGEQKVDPELCAKLAKMMREAGALGPEA